MSELAITFGRFNLPHEGHVQLIQELLEHGAMANVFVSSAPTNNDWDLRVLLLRHLCRSHDEEILKRVRFLQASGPFAAVEQSLKKTFPFKPIIVLGDDRRKLGRDLGAIYSCPVTYNKRTKSSTEIRKQLDYGVNPYKDRFALTIASVLRGEELHGESKTKSAAEIRKAA